MMQCGRRSWQWQLALARGWAGPNGWGYLCYIPVPELFEFCTASTNAMPNRCQGPEPNQRPRFRSWDTVFRKATRTWDNQHRGLYRSARRWFRLLHWIRTAIWTLVKVLSLAYHEVALSTVLNRRLGFGTALVLQTVGSGIGVRQGFGLGLRDMREVGRGRTAPGARAISRPDSVAAAKIDAVWPSVLLAVPGWLYVTKHYPPSTPIARGRFPFSSWAVRHPLLPAFIGFESYDPNSHVSRFRGSHCPFEGSGCGSRLVP
jgi:hypothetical protein